jgi:hypothetical protein
MTRRTILVVALLVLAGCSGSTGKPATPEKNDLAGNATACQKALTSSNPLTVADYEACYNGTISFGWKCPNGKPISQTTIDGQQWAYRVGAPALRLTGKHPGEKDVLKAC